MHSRAFVFVLLCLTILVILTSPPVLGELLTAAEPSPTPTPVPSTATPTATATLDPFAFIPTATPPGRSEVAMARSLPTPSLGQLPPTFTPSPVLPIAMPTLTLGALPHVTITPPPTAVGGGRDSGGDVGGTVVSAIRLVIGQGGIAALLIGGSLGLLSIGVIVWVVARGRHAKTKEHPQ